MKLRQRGFYYMAITVDPTNPQVAYVPEVDGVYKTANGGKKFTLLDPPHGDNHAVWVNPRNPKILLVGNDGGGTVSVNGGDTWSTEHNQPTGQYYHVAIDDQFPFHVFGAAQDEGAFEGPSAALGGGIGQDEWFTVALGESTFVAPEPGSPYVTYGSGYYSSFVRLDRKTGDAKNVSPWPRYMAGASSAETRYRFGWTHPIFFSPADPHELVAAAQVVFSSTDRGQTWKVLSPDLTRNDPSTEGPSGGPVDVRPNRRGDISRHCFAGGLAARRERLLGRLRRRVSARFHRSRRALERSHAAPASAVDADQLDRTVAYRQRHGVSERFALHVG